MTFGTFTTPGLVLFAGLAMIGVGTPTLGQAQSLVTPIKSAPVKGQTSPRAPKELLVRYKATANAAQARAGLLAQRADIDRIEALRMPNKLRADAADAASARLQRWHRVRLAPGASPEKVSKELAADPDVEAIEPNYVYRASAVPNDPSFNQLWGLHNIGQSGGESDADVDAPEAWNRSKGSKNVIVAVIDSGVDFTHPDLRANMWVNGGETAGNGKDDDGNGFVDDRHGYDFANDDGSPMDDYDHGTHVAGTIAAVGNNGIGVVGVNWKARIMALKFLDADGFGTTADAVDAILYATAMGARVINASWGGGGESQALTDAIAAANRRGVLFVAAAGNDGSNNDEVATYPANYKLANVVSVAATDDIDGLAYFSNYGRNRVHLGAPGVDILSTVPGNGYDTFSGTSMAAPHVSGAAALLLAQDVTRKAAYLKMRLLASVDTVKSLTAITASGGRLNVNSAMDCSPSELEINPVQPTHDFTATLGARQSLRVWTGTCSPVRGVSLSAAFDNGEPALNLFDDGAHDDGAANDGFFANSWTPQHEGPVEVTFQASHANYGSAAARIAGAVELPYAAQKTTYAWIDPSRGTPLALPDDGEFPVDIGFAFHFYGETYTSIHVGSNGLLTFGADGAVQFFNSELPDGHAPNATVAPFWDDLNPTAGGRVYVRRLGTAPNRRLVIGWVNVPHYFSAGGGTFEAILNEADASIVFQYRDVDFGTASVNRGASATIGIEDETGTSGIQYGYDQAILKNNLAIRFARTRTPPAL